MTQPQFTVAQVTPYAWEERHREVNHFVERLSQQLVDRGHRVAIVTPSSSRKLVRESRALIRKTKDDPDALWADGPLRVLGVGQALPFPPARRGGSVALPIDLAHTIEELFELNPFDLVHVHEPFAPSAASAALRHSRALNIGTFHAPAERMFSTQVARRFVELFFGRLDARTASYGVTSDLVTSFFGGQYEIVPPGGDSAPSGKPAPMEILLPAVEERGALRLFLRALRKLPADLEWSATVWHRTQAQAVAPMSLPKALRDRVRFLGPKDAGFSELATTARVVVLSSSGIAPAGATVMDALAAGAVPVTSSIEIYRELLDEGELGLLFNPGDVQTLAAQIERLLRDDELHGGFLDHATKCQFGWDRVADDFEGIYSRLLASRHETAGNPELHKKLSTRPKIDVDLHMHTDHSHDCAVPVDVLLETAKARGLGAIAVTDHNEISGALDAAAKAEGIKIIVGEEVKTKDQGEVIGLFINEKIERGMSLEETIAEIKRQRGLVYVPHPFDRMHSVPDYENLLRVIDQIDLLEVFNPRVAFSAFNEEAARFAAKYRIVAGAGSDSHVPQGLGSVRIQMHDFDGPQEFLESLRAADIVRRRSSLLYVQALKFIQTKTPFEGGMRSAANGPSSRRKAAASSRAARKP